MPSIDASWQRPLVSYGLWERKTEHTDTGHKFLGASAYYVQTLDTRGKRSPRVPEERWWRQMGKWARRPQRACLPDIGLLDIVVN